MESVLTHAELAELEASLLPALERHHLRLLAHGLRTLQVVAGRREGPAPNRQLITAWAQRQPLIAEDPSFSHAFIDQLLSAADQLRAIAVATDRAPLDLDLADLVGWARQQADGRIARSALNPAPAPPAVTPPPG